MLIGLAIGIGMLGLLAFALMFANPLPSRSDLPTDTTISSNESSLLSSAKEVSQGRDGESGLLLLRTGVDAFAMRNALVRQASRTIDAQYYIWEGDLSGRMLLSEMIAAADRGVRVRILIDDNATAGLDGMWAGVNGHPNISVRLFNPLTIRGFRPANYLFDFFRLNRRMHNKSLTVDNAATVVGGRNIGDAYFGVADEGLFIDVDALAIGAVVPDVVAEFQTYWESTPAYPAERILAPSSSISLAELRNPDYDDADRAEAYHQAVQQASRSRRIESIESELVWATVRLLADDPHKALGSEQADSLLVTHLRPLFEDAQSSVDVVSAYFVPGTDGAELFGTLASRGVHTRIATNSLQVTDVPLVHAGYVPHRSDLLKAGVELYEARPRGNEDGTEKSLGQTRFGGGGESVHAKVFQIDEEIFFVGSFNLDPRSARLNCEMGFVVNSPELARALRATLVDRLPEATYRVFLDEDARMGWASEVAGKEVVAFEEPGTGLLSRTLISFLSNLPIRWLL